MGEAELWARAVRMGLPRASCVGVVVMEGGKRCCRVGIEKR